MSQHQYQHRLENELDSLNSLIDEKIIRGLSYRSEAKRHKMLIRQARQMRRQPLFSRVLSYVGLF
ncbi:MAG: hypothetical protein QG633_452 [Patescibacteria group bacterium]|nr:hypothetical protein [Patescibacteria group bacterium]